MAEDTPISPSPQHTPNHFTALLDFVRDYLVSRHQKGTTRKVKPIWIYWSKRQ